MSATLGRRLVAELLGTAMLVTVVVGSGIAAQRLSPDDVGLQLLENSTATFLGLTVLILMFGPVSGAHFNPVVSAADWFLGRRSDTGLSGRDVAAYSGAQVVGGIAGAVLANVTFEVSVFELATTERVGQHLWVAEVVATAGLVLLIFALARSGRGAIAAPAVGAYIGAAYWFASSTSFANPAVTVGRVFSDTFAGIAPGSVPAFVLAQVLGAGLAVVLVRYLYPQVAAIADDVVVPHGKQVPQVVFACVRNGGRSVASRVLAEHYAGGRVVALSAGTQPGDHIHPEVAAVLEELGLDSSRERPTMLTRDTIAASDLAITLGCGEECPYVPGVRYRDWPVEDPGGQDEATVRRIVADLDRRVRDLLVELVPDLDLPPSVVSNDGVPR